MKTDYSRVVPRLVPLFCVLFALLGCKGGSTSAAEEKGTPASKQRVALMVPDQQNFDYLVATIDDPKRLEPGLSARLNEWPNEERRASPEILRSAAEGTDVPWAPYVRSVYLSSLDYGLSFGLDLISGQATAFESLFKSARTWTINTISPDDVDYLLKCCSSNLRELTVFGPALSKEVIEAMGAIPSLRSLRLVGLSHNCFDHPPDVVCIQTYVTKIVNLLIGQPWPNLSSLSISVYGLRSQDLKSMANSRIVSGLTSLELRGGLDDDGIATLANSASLERLEKLKLAYVYDGTPGISSLADSTNLKSLRHLTIEGISRDQAKILASGPFVRQLSQLDLLPRRGISMPRLGPGEIKTIAKHGSNLQSLNLNQLGSINSTAARQLSSHTGNSMLALRLDDVRLTAQGAAALSRGWSQLTHLSVANNAIGDAGLEALASGGALDGLNHLDLHATSIGADGIQALVQSKAPTSLEHLDLSNNDLGVRGIVLLSTREWPKLRSLNINSTTVEMPERFFDSRMPKLAYFRARDNNLGPEDIRHLSQWGAISHLQHIALDGNPVGGAESLVDILTSRAKELVYFEGKFRLDDAAARKIVRSCLASPNPILSIDWEIGPETVALLKHVSPTCVGPFIQATAVATKGGE